MCVVHHMHAVPVGVREGVKGPGTELRSSLELPCGCWESHPGSRAENLKSWPPLKLKTFAPWKNLSTEQVERPAATGESVCNGHCQNTHRVLKTQSKQANSPLKEVKGQSAGQIPPQHTECMTPGWDPDSPKTKHTLVWFITGGQCWDGVLLGKRWSCAEVGSHWEPFVPRSQLRYEFFKCREKWRLLRTTVRSRQTSVHTSGLRSQGRGRSRDLAPVRTGLCADWAVEGGGSWEEPSSLLSIKK